MFGRPPVACLCAKSWVRQSYNIRTKIGTETSAKQYWILETLWYSEFEMCPYRILFFHACQFNTKHRHKTPKPCKKELQTKWWLAENISLGHLGWLVAYCLNNRILTLWDLKREISTQPATNGSGQQAKHNWQHNFLSVNSIVVMTPTVLFRISHISIFNNWRVVCDMSNCVNFLTMNINRPDKFSLL